MELAARGRDQAGCDRRERIDRFPLQQDVHLDERGALLADFLVVEAGVPAGTRLQDVEEVEDENGCGDC